MEYKIKIKRNIYSIVPNFGFNQEWVHRMLPSVPMITDGYKLGENEVRTIRTFSNFFSIVGEWMEVNVLDFRPELGQITIVTNDSLKFLKYVRLTHLNYDYILLNRNLLCLY